MEENLSQQSNQIRTILLSVVITALVIGFVVFIIEEIRIEEQNKIIQGLEVKIQEVTEQIKKEKNTVTETKLATLEDIDNSTLKTYTNDKFGFEFKYPASLFIDTKEYVWYKGRDAITVNLTIQDSELSVASPPTVMSFSINGPSIDYKTNFFYKASIGTDGFVVVDEIEKMSEDSRDIGLRAVTSNESEDYMNWYFKFDPAEGDLEPIFREILESFHFINKL